MPQSSVLCTLDRVTLVLRPLSLNITVRLFVLSPMLNVFEKACEVGLNRATAGTATQPTFKWQRDRRSQQRRRERERDGTHR